jgi:hypothetical protein
MKPSNTTAKTFTIAAVAVLALSIAPAAKAANKGCSNASLAGTFSQKNVGSVISPAARAGSLANVGTLTFDGSSGVTGAVSNSFNGNIGSSTQTGTYIVNPDCTGTFMVLISPAGFTSHYFFVIDDSGSELQMICTDPGVVFSGTARRQFPMFDWRQ